MSDTDVNMDALDRTASYVLALTRLPRDGHRGRNRLDNDPERRHSSRPAHHGYGGLMPTVRRIPNIPKNIPGCTYVI